MIRAGAAMLLLFASVAQAQTTYPDYEDLYVNDFGNMIPDSLEQRLRLKLQALKAARDIEFTILTIDRMSDYGHVGEIEPFATGLFNDWGIGDATRNDGVLLFVSRFDRKFRIELGSGYGTSLNGEMQKIADNTITPEFRQSAYYAGIDLATNKIIYAITDRYPGEYDANILTRTVNAAIRFIKAGFWWIIGIGSPFALHYSVKAYRHRKRTKPRICQYDGAKMYWLTEAEEDAFLQDGQIVEEELKVIDHDVWACRQCDNIRIEAYPTWFSKYKQCPECTYKTQFVTKQTNVPATYSSSGSGTASYVCKNCNHAYSKTYTIPMKQKSSSSSSGGGSSSSFGGGSSSGGGASGSW
jgi:uncharacterized protein